MLRDDPQGGYAGHKQYVRAVEMEDNGRLVGSFDRLQVRDEALELRPHFRIKHHLVSELDVRGSQLLAVVKHDPRCQMEREGIARRRDGPPLGQSGYDLALQTKIGEAVVHHALRLRPVAALQNGIEPDGRLGLKDPKRAAFCWRLRVRGPAAYAERAGDRRGCARTNHAKKRPAGHRWSAPIRHGTPPLICLSRLHSRPDIRYSFPLSVGREHAANTPVFPLHFLDHDVYGIGVVTRHTGNNLRDALHKLALLIN